jgi:hypothetical protein
MPAQHHRKERLYRLFTRITSALANPYRLELLDAPYGNERPYNALRLALNL